MVTGSAARGRSTGVALVACCALAGCEAIGTVQPDLPWELRLDAVEWPDTVAAGDSVPLKVRLTDSTGRVLARASVRWSSPGAAGVRTGPTGMEAVLLFSRRGMALVRVVVDSTPAYRAVGLIDSMFVRTSWVAGSAGAAHACGVTVDGGLYCWGAGGRGQAGPLPTADTAAPVRVPFDGEALESSAGTVHTCALARGGRVLCWGENDSGQLGTGHTASSPVPLAIAGGGSTRYVQVSAGDRHACAVTADGEAECWGANEAAQLGLRSPGGCTAAPAACRVPQRVPALPAVRTMSAGGVHTCAVAEDERAYCWGDSPYGAAAAPPGSWLPHPVDPHLLFTVVEAGARHTCGLTPGGTAWCWGANERGQLGSLGAAEVCEQRGCSTRPVPVAGGITFTAISTGETHTCGLATNQRMYCWGGNEHGQLGAPPAGACEGAPCARTPVPVAGGIRFRHVSAGAGHTCGVALDRRVYCWGDNRSGQLGNRSRSSSHVPVAVAEGQ